MTSIRNAILIATMLVVTTPAMAEDAHHKKTDTDAATPDMSVPPGMMGADMMRYGMMKSMSQMMDPAHIEGRIAFLQTELKIKDIQQPLWKAYANFMRKATHDQQGMMQEMQMGMMSNSAPAKDTLLQILDRHEHMMAAHLDQLRQMKAAVKPLYDALDETQKTTADELLMPHGMGSM